MDQTVNQTTNQSLNQPESMDQAKQASTQTQNPYQELHMNDRQRRISFGKWLKSRREAVHLTQMDLARRLNYENPQIISNIERGFSALPSRRVYDFAGALKCSGLELELRRVLSSSKDDECASALETVLRFLPVIEAISKPTLTVDEGYHLVNQFREINGLQPLFSSLNSISSPKAAAEY